MNFAIATILISLMSTTATSHASGCDCSCFSLEQKITQQKSIARDYLTIEPQSGTFKVKDRPGEQNLKTEVVFHGYENSGPIDPYLFSKIQNDKPFIEFTMMNVSMDIKGDCGNEALVTGRFKLKFWWRSGEVVELFQPPLDELVDSSNGFFIEKNALPLPIPN